MSSDCDKWVLVTVSTVVPLMGGGNSGVGVGDDGGSGGGGGGTCNREARVSTRGRRVLPGSPV